MCINYYVEKKSKYGEGYYTYGVESSKIRAIKMAKEINGRVKDWRGKMIYDQVWEEVKK